MKETFFLMSKSQKEYSNKFCNAVDFQIQNSEIYTPSEIFQIDAKQDIYYHSINNLLSTELYYRTMININK